MATASTGWKCAHATATSDNTDTSIKIKVTCYWQNDGWNYNMNNVSAWVYCNGESYKVKDDDWIDTTANTNGKFSMGSHTFTISKGTSAKNISCYAKITSTSSYVSGTKSSTATTVSVSAKTSYTVKYNANGGSGAPSSQTKWHGTNLTLSSTKPTRTGYTFQGWGTSASDTSVNYAAGATYSSNAGITLYAIWKANTYTVKYNANGGSGAPGNQTKTYGKTLTLSSTKPTRTNYNFKGWATSASGSVKYAAGASYTANAAVTLYAVWELAYTKPRITSFSAKRCNEDGSTNESGTYVLFKFNWATDKEVVDIIVDWGIDSNWSSGSYSNYTITASGTSGSITQVVGDGAVSAETTYYGRAYVKDSSGWTRSATATIATPKFPIDVKKGGKGVAIGKAAETENLLDIAYGTLFRENPDVKRSTGTTHIQAVRTDTGTWVWMGVGSGGYNHGLYSSKLDGWMINVNSEGQTAYHTSGLYSPKQGGVYFNEYGNILTKEPMTTGHWIIRNNNENYFKLEWETKSAVFAGNVYAPNIAVQNSEGTNIYVPEIQKGSVTVTPSAANTPTGKVVTFSKKFSGSPIVVASIHSTVPGKTVTGVAAYGESDTGATIYVCRTNTTNTGVHWIATY